MFADRGCESHLPRMTDPSPITRLNVTLEGRYHLERELGEGGRADHGVGGRWERVRLGPGREHA